MENGEHTAIPQSPSQIEETSYMSFLIENVPAPPAGENSTI